MATSAQNVITLEPSLSEFSLIAPIDNAILGSTTIDFEWEQSIATSTDDPSYQVIIFRKNGNNYEHYGSAQILDGIEISGAAPWELFTKDTKVTITNLDMGWMNLGTVSYRWHVRAFSSCFGKTKFLSTLLIF